MKVCRCRKLNVKTQHEDEIKVRWQQYWKTLSVGDKTEDRCNMIDEGDDRNERRKKYPL